MRIPELDGVRAIAILLVIGCHYEPFSELAGGLPSYGWIGVDIFFVLSGFLITSILIELRNTASPLKTFYVRRVLRIFPVYYLMILVISAVSLACNEHLVHFGYYVSRFCFLQSFEPSPALLHKAWTSILNLDLHRPLFSHVRLPGQQVGAPLAPWGNSLGIAWSLSIEEYFYLLWAPAVIFLKDRWKVGVAAAVLFFASVAIEYLGFQGLPDYFDFFCRVDTMMAGALLALFLRWRSRASVTSRRRADALLGVLAVILAAVCVAVLALNWPFLGRELRDSPSFMLLGLPAFSLLIALTLGWIVRRRGALLLPMRLLRCAPLRALGVISYSLYLVHIPVYYASLRAAAMFRLTGPAAGWIVSAAALFVSILCSALSWKFFETPILRLKDRWAPTQARVALDVAAG